MKANIVRIGNSRGIRIPAALLEQTGLQDEVEIRCEGNSLIIEPAARVREGWAESAKKMAACGGDELIDGDWPETDFERDDWQW